VTEPTEGRGRRGKLEELETELRRKEARLERLRDELEQKEDEMERRERDLEVRAAESSGDGGTDRPAKAAGALLGSRGYSDS